MTVERAFCHKLMLEVGLTDSFDRDLDELLEQEDPLSDLTLDLSTCGSDRNKQIHILNEYILSVAPEKIDRGTVFSLVIDEFRSLYEKQPEELDQLTLWMYSVAASSGWWTEDPWNTMYLMNDWYTDVKYGELPKEFFEESCSKLLYEKTAVDPMDLYLQQQRQNTLLSRLRRFFGIGKAEKKAAAKELPKVTFAPGALFLPCLARRGSAYFEFQYCKTEGTVKKILKSNQHWLPDSLVVYIDDQDRLMEAYLPFLEKPESPNGSSTFCYYGINYYPKERTARMLDEIKAARPEGWETLIPWLEKAATEYNGFYFLGI